MKVGDTITATQHPASNPLPGYKELQPMVFCGLYPVESGGFSELREALERLQREMDTAHERINTLINRKIYLEGQLATVPQKMGVIRVQSGRWDPP